MEPVGDSSQSRLLETPEWLSSGTLLGLWRKLAFSKCIQTQRVRSKSSEILLQCLVVRTFYEDCIVPSCSNIMVDKSVMFEACLCASQYESGCVQLYTFRRWSPDVRGRGFCENASLPNDRNPDPALSLLASCQQPSAATVAGYFHIVHCCGSTTL